MKKVAVLICALALMAASCTKDDPILQAMPPYSDGFVKIADKEISVDFAVETPVQNKGLGGRESIEENQGMIFIFQVPDILEFWMKDMKFPIDIIWIKGDEVIDISPDAQPEPGVDLSQLKIYTPKKPADRVLEVKGGWAARNGLKIGDKVEITRVIAPTQ